jgi:hypothetical protein
VQVVVAVVNQINVPYIGKKIVVPLLDRGHEDVFDLGDVDVFLHEELKD